MRVARLGEGTVSENGAPHARRPPASRHECKVEFGWSRGLSPRDIRGEIVVEGRRVDRRQCIVVDDRGGSPAIYADSEQALRKTVLENDQVIGGPSKKCSLLHPRSMFAFRMQSASKRGHRVLRLRASPVTECYAVSRSALLLQPGGFEPLTCFIE